MNRKTVNCLITGCHQNCHVERYSVWTLTYCMLIQVNLPTSWYDSISCQTITSWNKIYTSVNNLIVYRILTSLLIQLLIWNIFSDIFTESYYIFNKCRYQLQSLNVTILNRVVVRYFNLLPSVCLWVLPTLPKHMTLSPVLPGFFWLSVWFSRLCLTEWSLSYGCIVLTFAMTLSVCWTCWKILEGSKQSM